MAKKTIKLKKYVHIVEERIAHADILPGMLLALRSDGKVQAHGVASGKHPSLFALEDELQGRTVADKYGANERVQITAAIPGEQIQGILKAGQNVAVGDYLVSAGDGTLAKATEYDAGPPIVYPSYFPVGIALEALDLSAGGAVNTFIAVAIV